MIVLKCGVHFIAIFTGSCRKGRRLLEGRWWLFIDGIHIYRQGAVDDVAVL